MSHGDDDVHDLGDDSFASGVDDDVARAAAAMNEDDDDAGGGAGGDDFGTGDDEADESRVDDGHGGAGFSSDDDGGQGGADASYAGANSADFAEDYSGGDVGDLDPSQIRAPGGAGSDAASAAARLARAMAGGGGDGDDGASGEDPSGDYGDDLEAREQRKRQVAQMEAEMDAGARRVSKRASNRASTKSRRDGDDEEEKESVAGSAAHSNRRASQRASNRSGGGAPAAAGEYDDDLDGGAAPYDDEFGSELSGGVGGGGSDDDDGDEEEEQVESEEDERTIEDVARAKEEREHLIEVNKIRQRQIALILEREKSLHGGATKPSRGGQSQQHTSEEKTPGGFDTAGAMSSSSSAGVHPEQIRSEYIKNLESLNVLWDTLESKREDAEERIDRLTSKLDTFDERATELSDSFKSFKREIAKEAKFSRTGKPIKLKRILAFEAAEEARDRDVARVRLRHINLLNELRTLEDAVRVKEKLAEGLHLIDFEQLKIENQTLNEKIEERNDELHKLKKKTTTTVQVLTHIKEKLQCVREENTHSQAELRSINHQVQSLRDQLTKTKHVRDASRGENQSLKQKQGFIGSDLLVSDFENRKGDIDLLRTKVEGLKAKWRNLNSLSLKANSVERMHARMETNATLQRQTHYATVKFGGANGQSGATQMASPAAGMRR